MLLLLLWVSTSIAAATPDYYIKQGSVVVTQDDLDAFSYTIPKSQREGFFWSDKRLKSTLLNLLNKKHIAQYGLATVNQDDINELYQARVANLYRNHTAKDILEEAKMIKIKQNIKINVINDLVKQSIKHEVMNDDSYEEVAEEQYLVNREPYKTLAEVDYKFITVIFDETSKQAKIKIANQLIANLSAGKLQFSNIIEKYNKMENIEMAGEVKANKHVQGNKFVEQLFASGTGLIQEPIIENSRLFIVHVDKITPAKYKKFTEVKDDIVASLKQEIISQKYNALIIQLTRGKEVQINETAILSIKNLYTN